jgi:glycosyltransferase involved in cell wall biosynthesis
VKAGHVSRVRTFFGTSILTSANGLWLTRLWSLPQPSTRREVDNHTSRTVLAERSFEINPLIQLRAAVSVIPLAPTSASSCSISKNTARHRCTVLSAGRMGVPFLTTMHGRLDLPGLPDVIRTFPEASFVSISDHQRLPLPDANWISTIQHGVPAELFRPSFEPGSYLAFLGRLSAEKGPEGAIRIARAAGMPLRIAAKIPRAETAYFKKHLEPHIDNKGVQLVGEVDEARKQPFLADAAALLFPIDWPEPFGLVMIEAMACGTPVIAYRSGSVPEVIDEGATGFIVESEEQAVHAVSELERLDRRTIRARFEGRFSAGRMAQEYAAQYRKLIANRIAGREGVLQPSET